MTVDEVLADLGRRFPKHVELLKAWAPTYRRKLSGFNPSTIEALYVRTVDDWPHPGPPKAVEILKEIRPDEEQQVPPKRPTRHAWAEKVMRLPEGKIAIRDGCARELWMWALKNPGQVPGADVLADCAEATARFHRRLDDLEAGSTKLPSGTGGMAVVKAGQAMLDFEARLRRDYGAVS